jgi:hypothetical protein
VSGGSRCCRKKPANFKIVAPAFKDFADPR